MLHVKLNPAVAKVAFKKNTLFASKVDFKLRQKLVKYCIWSTALYGTEKLGMSKSRSAVPWKFQNLVLKWMGKTSWNNCVRNEIIHKLKKNSIKSDVSPTKHQSTLGRGWKNET